jgi:hypothetical protein
MELRMEFGRRSFLAGAGLGVAATCGRIPISAQDASWQLEKRFTLKGLIIAGTEPLTSGITCANENGEIGGSLVETDIKFSPAIWSSTGKGTRLPSGEFGGQILGLNTNGVAVGREYLNVGGLVEPPTLEARQSWPAMWVDGEPVPFEFPGYAGRLNAINDDGLIGGYYLAEYDYPYGFLWKEGVLTVLTSGFDNLIPTHISANGTVAGYKLGANELNGVLTYYAQAAILIDDKVQYFGGVPSTLSDFGEDDAGTLTVAGVTDDRELLLSLQGSETNKGELYWWSPEGGFKRIPNPGTATGWLRSPILGTNGQIVAVWSAADETQPELVIWTDLDSEPVAISFEQQNEYAFLRPVAINSSGQTVLEGLSEGKDPEALIISPA